MANAALSALMQAALRRRLLTKERAMELGNTLLGAGADPQALREKLRQSDAVEAMVLNELLPAAELPAIDGYQRIARLGDGRTASTWLGLDGQGQQVVIKVFHATRLRPGGDVERFCADLQPLIGLNQRYLVNYLAVLTAADGRACLIQQYQPGRDLTARAATKGPVSETKALVMLRHAGKGLRVLEKLERNHGLLHPGNVLLDGEGKARLSDYGYAVSPSLGAVRKGWDSRSLVLQAWAAPETLADPPQSNVLTDCYALACIGFWMLAGKAPFLGSSDQMVQQHLSAPRPDVRKLSPQVSLLTAKTLFKAIQADPANRYDEPRKLVLRLQKNFEELTGATAKAAGETSGDETTFSQALPEKAPAKSPVKAAAKPGTAAAKPEEKAKKGSDKRSVVKPRAKADTARIASGKRKPLELDEPE